MYAWKASTNNNLLAWVLLLLLSLVWGSSFILIKKALIAFDPVQVGAARIVLAFLAFLPLFLWQFRKVDWKKWKYFIIVGICGSGLPAFLFAIAQQHIASGITGVLNSLTPIFTFLLSVIAFRKRFSYYQLAGILAGFLGIVIVFLTGEHTKVNLPFFYGLLIILATISYAISANTLSGFLQDVSPVMISTLSFMLIGPFVLIWLLQSGFIETALNHEHGRWSFGALLILSLIGTFTANILFFKLIQITDAIFSTSVAFLIPFVALFWGFIDGELITIYHFVALMLILGGVWLIKSHSKQLKMEN